MRRLRTMRAGSRCRTPPARVRLLTVNIGREERSMLYLVRALVYLLETVLAEPGGGSSAE
ncbi:MAG: hypothetical protein NTX53_17925 [candidate division WOR-3 bacterium]|nr:hypothetical protein [candidate division WOR-3 bacterium]